MTEEIQKIDIINSVKGTAENEDRTMKDTDHDNINLKEIMIIEIEEEMSETLKMITEGIIDEMIENLQLNIHAKNEANQLLKQILSKWTKILEITRHLCLGLKCKRRNQLRRKFQATAF